MKYPPIFKDVPHLIHGGDYNPDQWLDTPEILSEDIRLMKLAGINSATVAIFAWSALEPREGEHHLDWLEEIVDNLYKNGIYTVAWPHPPARVRRGSISPIPKLAAPNRTVRSARMDFVTITVSHRRSFAKRWLTSTAYLPNALPIIRA